MTVLLDGLGQWRTLGIVTPQYNTWLQYSTPASEGFSTFRLTFDGTWYEGWQWCYLKSVYTAAATPNESKWTRVYPSNAPKLIYSEPPVEFVYINPSRYFQIMKSHKRIRARGATFTDRTFSVKLEEFSPYPEVLEERRKQALKEEVIQAIAQAVVALLPPSS